MVKKLLQASANLPIRERGAGPPAYSKAAGSGGEPTIGLHPFPSGDGFLVKINPPQRPEWVDDIKRHVPNDIVLVIDKSTSMGDVAKPPKPAEGTAEKVSDEPTLRLLALAKKAAKAITKTMNAEDRLGIVTFSEYAHVVQELTPMTEKGKKTSRANIKGIKIQGCTNLWDGLMKGLEVLKSARPGGGRESMKTVMVLTDGMPNHGEPARGHMRELIKMGPPDATIHTFGFGYCIRSGLLQSIAEFGGGNYGFIPDEGMLGTVFVNAVANLQSTHSTKAVLTLTYPTKVNISETMGETLTTSKPTNLDDTKSQLVVQLGNIQYGQTRDLPFAVQVSGSANATTNETPPKQQIKVELKYQVVKSGTRRLLSMCDLTRSATRSTSISSDEFLYHISRARLCRLFSDLFPIKGQTLEHYRIDRQSVPLDSQDKLQSLIATLPPASTNEDLASLRADLTGEVTLAMQAEQWHVWGRHYLPSLWSAHAGQICNNFKDPGPGRYGLNSPLFDRCREDLNDAYGETDGEEDDALDMDADVIMPPGSKKKRKINMRLYHNARNGCFVASTLVRIVDVKASGADRADRAVKPISELRAGDIVKTPCGDRSVRMLVQIPVRDMEMVSLPDHGGVVVTPWHPIKLSGDKQYVFPSTVAGGVQVRYSGSVYTVLLERDEDVESHAICLANADKGGADVWGVTLGNGLTKAATPEEEVEAAELELDVRTHAFFGNYDLVQRELDRLGVAKTGVVVAAGARRGEDGKICAFVAPRRELKMIKTSIIPVYGQGREVSINA